MKHTIFFLFLLTGLTSFAQDKEVQFGIKAGANLSMFSASVNSNPSLKPGFHVGIYMRSTTSEKFHFRPELYFSSQGEKTEYVTGNGNTVLGKTETTINAINIPLLFEVGRKVNFQFGPQVGVLLSGKEKGNIGTQKLDEDLKDIMKPVDFSVVLGLGLNATENLNLGVRYNFGITPVFETLNGAPSDYPKFANRVIHFYVGYSF